MKMRRLGVMLAVGLFPVLASAQDWRATPTYTTFNLEAGFSPDPQVQAVTAGGRDSASHLGGDCKGNIHNPAPDVDLNYQTGSYQLYVYVRSSADTTLVINAPDGRWYCNDDAMGVDPVVVFPKAPSGNYNIWVGTYGSEQVSATLHVSEIDPR